MGGTVCGRRLFCQLRQSCRLWIGVMIAVTLAGELRAGERTPARGPKVDHAVMPAGGMATGQTRCSQCQRSACPQCRISEAHHHGHAQCQHGLCPAHCPVRPDVFGFYGTRWRRWPGSGVVQASNNDAATPARPPRAEVPGAEEESLEPDSAAEDLSNPAADAKDKAKDDTDADAEDLPVPAAAASGAREDVVSRTAWRTFTATPPRLAAQP